MIRQIAPQFFTTDIPGTLVYYKDKLGFECLGAWQDPPTYAIVARDQHAIHFRCAEPPTANPDKYTDELLDAYLLVEDADALYAEYAAKGVEFTRPLARTYSAFLWSGPQKPTVQMSVHKSAAASSACAIADG
jgi:hypothetical protein